MKWLFSFLPLQNRMSFIYNYCSHSSLKFLPFQHLCYGFVVNKNFGVTKQQTAFVDVFWDHNFLLAFLFHHTLQKTNLHKVAYFLQLITDQRIKWRKNYDYRVFLVAAMHEIIAHREIHVWRPSLQMPPISQHNQYQLNLLLCEFRCS